MGPLAGENVLGLNICKSVIPHVSQDMLTRGHHITSIALSSNRAKVSAPIKKYLEFKTENHRNVNLAERFFSFSVSSLQAR